MSDCDVTGFYKSPLWFAKHGTNISHHSKVTKTRFYHQKLWNVIIYCCYCIVFVDLLYIFEFAMYLWIVFIILHVEECDSQQTGRNSLVAYSAEFITVHALTLHAVHDQFLRHTFCTLLCTIQLINQMKKCWLTVNILLLFKQYSQQLIDTN